MKSTINSIVQIVSFLSGLVTIFLLFFKPEEISGFIYDNFTTSTILLFVVSYSRFMLLIPIATGIGLSSQYGGFSFPRIIFDPAHLISSFVIFEFWQGFLKGIRIIGYIIFPIFFVVLVKELLS